MADTPDPIADTLPEPLAPPSAPTPPAPKRTSPVLPVLGGVVAAVIGFGLAQVVPNGWPITDTTALQTTLATQADQIAALEARLGQPTPDADLTARVTALEAAPDQTAPDQTTRIDALEARIAAIPAPTPDADLTARVTALEAAPAQTDPDQTAPDQTTRIDALEARIAAIPAPTANPDLTQLRAEIDALKSGSLPATATAAIDAKLAEATASIAAIKADAEAIADAAARRAALRQILAALDSGAPYGAAVADMAGQDLPAFLTDNAQSGLPTLQTLRTSFPDAARVALDAALQANMGESWAERVGAFLRGQTGARSLTPREGTDPDAVLSRAEAAVAAGDLATALTELDALPSQAQAALTDWRAKAGLRLQAATAVQGLLAAAEH